MRPLCPAAAMAASATFALVGAAGPHLGTAEVPLTEDRSTG